MGIENFIDVSASSFFQDVPEEDELPIDFQIPGPIPDLVDLYTLYFETTNEARVSVPQNDFEDLYVKKVETHNKKPSPSPRVSKRSMKSTCQKLKTCNNSNKSRVSKKSKETYNKNNKPRVSKKSMKTGQSLEKTYNKKPRVSKRSLKSRERISEEKLNQVLEDMPMFFPKKRRSNTRRITCGNIVGKKNPWVNAALMLLR